MRALRRLHRRSEASPFAFLSERGAPFTMAGFARMMEGHPTGRNRRGAAQLSQYFFSAAVKV